MEQHEVNIGDTVYMTPEYFLIVKKKKEESPLCKKLWEHKKTGYIVVSTQMFLHLSVPSDSDFGDAFRQVLHKGSWVNSYAFASYDKFQLERPDYLGDTIRDNIGKKQCCNMLVRVCADCRAQFKKEMEAKGKTWCNAYRTWR